ncbi:hypothetical protein [Thermus brockianus]
MLDLPEHHELQLHGDPLRVLLHPAEGALGEEAVLQGVGDGGAVALVVGDDDVKGVKAVLRP